MMNPELRTKTAERGETCSAKRTHRVRKRKAGTMNGRKSKLPYTEKGTGKTEGVMGGKRNGQTNPPGAQTQCWKSVTTDELRIIEGEEREG